MYKLLRGRALSWTLHLVWDEVDAPIGIKLENYYIVMGKKRALKQLLKHNFFVRLAAFRKKFLKVLLITLLLFVVVTNLQVLLVKYINPPLTVPMAWEWILKTTRDKPHIPMVYEWRDLSSISPHLQRAVMAAEDQRFLSHNGFDYIELQRVIEEFMEKRRIRGASTITMQAARSLFLVPGRNIFRKGAEAYYTVLMELFWDKKRILEIYLNCVDWGKGVVGAEAAARRYYACSAQALTPAQAALMTAILPAPHRWSPVKPDGYLRSRQEHIMKNMKLMPQL